MWQEQLKKKIPNRIRTETILNLPRLRVLPVPSGKSTEHHVFIVYS